MHHHHHHHDHRESRTILRRPRPNSSRARFPAAPAPRTADQHAPEGPAPGAQPEHDQRGLREAAQHLRDLVFLRDLLKAHGAATHELHDYDATVAAALDSLAEAARQRTTARGR